MNPEITTTSRFTIDADFPGGNIIVERIEGNHVYLRQDLRDTEGDWFYWSFKVRGAAGMHLYFHFTGSDVIGVRGPAVSADGGEHWSWLGVSDADFHNFDYTFDADSDIVHFAFAIPYLESNLRQFLAIHAGDPSLAVETLCLSRKDREIELLHAGRIHREPTYRLALTGRHHACESMASFTLEGFLERVLSETPTGEWFRQHVDIIAVPFVDKDGVEDGDQGKNRMPHDHNRDYAGESIHPSVAAIKQLFPEWSDGKCRLSLDVHCPARRGRVHEVVQFVEPSTNTQEATGAEMEKFSRILETTCSGPLPYSIANNLRFGQDWNVQSANGRNYSGWMSSLEGVKLAIGVEVPYANADGAEVNEASARALGGDLAEAARLYLEGIGPA